VTDWALYYNRRMIRAPYWLLIFVAAASSAGDGPSLMEEYNRAWIATGQLRYGDDVVATLKDIVARDRTFYRAYRTLASVYVKRREVAVGERYFQELAGQDPSNELAHYGLGELLRLIGNDAEAGEEYRNCASKNPRSWACLDRVQNYGFVGQLDVNRARIEYFNGLLRRDPHNSVSRLETAVALGNEGEYGKAADLLGEDVATVGQDRDRELEARILISRAEFIEKTGGGYEKALQPRSEALVVFEGLGDLEEQYALRESIAATKAALGKYDEAIESLEKILFETQAIKHLEAQSSAHSKLARVYVQGGELDKAIQHYEKSDQFRVQAGLDEIHRLTIPSLYARRGQYRVAIEAVRGAAAWFAKVNNLWQLAQSWRNLGVWYAELGEYANSLHYTWRSINLFRQLGHPLEANATIGNLPEVFSLLGDYLTAQIYAKQALQSARLHRDASEIQRNLGNLADLYFRTDKSKDALLLWEEALAMSPEVRMPAFDAGIRLSRCSYYEKQGNYDLALRDANAGLAIARQIQEKPTLGYALNREGFSTLKRGGAQEAAEFFQEALDLAEATGLRDVAWEARQGLGEAEASRGDLPEAMKYYRKAIADIETDRGQNLAPELKVNFLQDRLVVYQDAIAVLQKLHSADPSGGHDREAFRVAEQSRARAFLDSLAESKIQITKGISTEQRRRELRLKAAISDANIRLMKSDTPGNRAALKQAEQSLDDWAAELRNSDPRYQELRYPDPYTAEQVQRELLRNGEALVEYFVGDANLFAWVLTKSSSNMVKLPPVPWIEREVREYRRLLSHRPTNEAALTNYYGLSKRLHSALLAPLLPGTGGVSRLVIVPDGILHYLPFETLVSAKERFVVEDYTVTYVPSASVAASLRRGVAPGGRKKLQLLAFGDPRFGSASAHPDAGNQSSENLVRSAMESAGRRFTPIPMTRTEVNGIAGLLPAGASTVYLGPRASESNFKQEDLSRYKWIHIATHAVLDEQNPQRSGVVLTLPGTNGEDGILQPREIMELDIHADLVALSACETNLGKNVRGEGMVGLTRAFFYAGAPRMLVSQWKVNDIATAVLMKSFYQQMQLGKDIGRALRDAKVGMLHSDARLYQHPYFWAPFILAGTN